MTAIQPAVSASISEPANIYAQPAQRRLVSWIAICFAIALGISFRCSDLSNKVFWQDEVNTECIIAPRAHMIEMGTLLTRSDVLQTVAIDKKASVIDVVKLLADKEAEQTPLYYVIARVWTHLVGEGRWYLRLLSSLLGVAGIAAAYFLGKELFGDKLAGGLTAAAFALSPMLLVLGGQSRPYSLWVLTMTMASLALLRAMKNPTFRNWLMLSLALTLCLYTHLFSLLFVAAVCVWWIAQKRWSKGFILSVAASVGCFIPWLAVLHGHITSSTWLHANSLTIAGCAHSVGLSVTRCFLFSNTDPSFLQNCCVWLLLLLAFVYVFKKTPQRSSTFIISLFFAPALLLTIYSLHSHLEIVAKDRYILPSLLALPLCCAGGLAALAKGQGKVSRFLYAGSFALFFGISLFSCAIVQMSPTWHKSDATMLKLAEAVNRYPSPILVCNAPHFEEIVLCYLLKDDARFMLVDDADSVSLPDPYIRVHIQRHASHVWHAEYVAPGKDPVSIEAG